MELWLHPNLNSALHGCSHQSCHQGFTPRESGPYTRWMEGWVLPRAVMDTWIRDTYEGCPESIQPFWISREPVAWQWGNLTAGQRRPYCATVNSHSPVGLVSRQWDAVDWACVLCDRRIHNDLASRSASSRQCAYPFYSSRAGFCW